MEVNTIVFIVGFALAAWLFAMGVSSIISSATDPVRRRVTAATSDGTQSASIDFGRVVDPLGKYVVPAASKERDTTRSLLIQAGFRSPDALKQFYGIKTVLAVGIPLLTFLAMRWAPQLQTGTVIFFTLLAAMIGVRLPDRVLSYLRNRRVKRLRDGFPDALDLLVVCVESGLGLAMAIERVSRELQISHPDLAQELALVNAEIRAGVDRPVALRNLANRSGVEDINGLVGLLVQTIRFGTSVADALRVYSDEFRDKRMQKAEEQAAKIGTKMIFPMVLCFFPSFFIVAIGPAVMRIIAAFQSM